MCSLDFEKDTYMSCLLRIMSITQCFKGGDHTFDWSISRYQVIWLWNQTKFSLYSCTRTPKPQHVIATMIMPMISNVLYILTLGNTKILELLIIKDAMSRSHYQISCICIGRCCPSYRWGKTSSFNISIRRITSIWEKGVFLHIKLPIEFLSLLLRNL